MSNLVDLRNGRSWPPEGGAGADRRRACRPGAVGAAAEERAGAGAAVEDRAGVLGGSGEQGGRGQVRGDAADGGQVAGAGRVPPAGRGPGGGGAQAPESGHALVDPVDGPGGGPEPDRGVTDLAGVRAEAAPGGDLEAVL